ncbi:MAG: hypothetical protein RML93_06255 [Anaerolineales bacterium]|nr:hypothetical protein [Anaerolineales bacterium]MCS7247085.1 hypothetical protein [Anaerolineales bacterium]MDW8160896.1 hypothetical protein [Anaerolineales bacterium]MDW8446876.1 hypothetical protein [Anaerolineales bacterium]
MRLIEQAVQDYFERKDEKLLNIASFIALSLDEIENSVQQTSAAWEKKGYWVKADHFYQEWSWVGEAKRRLINAVRQSDLSEIDCVLRELARHVRLSKEGVKAKRGIDYSDALKRFSDAFGF